MAFFKQKTRTRFDSTPEFAAKRLPVHPVSRYSTFSRMWKATRKISGYVPWPKNNNDDLFPCCHTCQVLAKPESDTKPLWYRTANAGWLRAEWFWDFGHMLPAGFVSYGVGVTPSVLQPERNRIFVLRPDNSRAYLDLDIEAHATLKGNQHEARIKIVNVTPLVNFPGEIVATNTGQIRIAMPRTVLFGRGVEVFERYYFESVEMPFVLPILMDGANFVREGNTILLDGFSLN